MAEQLFQVSMKAVIRNANGEILMQAEEQADGTVQMWDLPGGRLDEGEQPMAALQRELHEEISLNQKLDSEPVFIMNMISNLTFPPDEYDGKIVALMLIAYEVILPSGFEPKSGEPRSVLKWETTTEAAKLLSIKFPSEFCDYVAQL